ncbi:MAG TPA: hypothetical protein VFX43_20420 [Chitinophagaceae bacterium]|jgi:hypothetical protein|nr:hypothetical protein [Chitinophagaceae bacterium]
MKTTAGLLKGILITATALIGLSACQKNDSTQTPLKKQYTISPSNRPGSPQISGTVDFKEILNTDSVDVTIQLQGVSQDGSYPVYLRNGTSIENGAVAYNLGFVDGRNPTLTTSIPVSFSNLIKYNGCIDIYRNPNDTVTIVAQSEIGTNEVYKSYNMSSPLNNTINGEFRIYKRPTGAYVVIRIDTSVAHTGGVSHPARVYKSDGTRDFDLSDVSATTGVSATNTPDHTFDELTHYDGMIKVLASKEVQDVTLSQGQFK